MGKVKYWGSRLLMSTFLLVAAFVVAPHLDVQAAANDDFQACAAVFNADYYAAAYPDVAAMAQGDQLKLLNHYVTRGVYEGRNASPTFNATAYMNRYPDLQAAYGFNMPLYVAHYVRSGMREQRNAFPVEGVIDWPIPASYTLLGTYTTEYDPNAARGQNIANAASKVNGTVVAPGQTFSANRAIGPRSSANGFVEAPVFINKQHAMGIGGGVCQVSSTIYASTKMAGIRVTERHPHSLPVYYLPAGWDATISGNALDLKFVNNYNSNMVVYIMANNGHLTAALYLEN